MAFIDVTIGDTTFRAEMLSEASPNATGALIGALPLTGRVIQDAWSRDFMLVKDGPTRRLPGGDRAVPFQHPGLLVHDPESGNLALCYGQGRLQDGFGPIRAVVVAQLGGDMLELERLGRSLQFEGAKPIAIKFSEDQARPLDQAPEPEGRRVQVTLGTATTEGVLLEKRAPQTTKALAGLLPLFGMATNTVSSGPLARFWNPAGGPEGETPLDAPEDEVLTKIQSPVDRFYRQSILYPGFIYYNPEHPWRGLRMAAREATIMKGAVPSAAPTLVPVIQLVGDWSAIRAAAERLGVDGSTEMRIAFV